jgi:hypothetical protein
MKSQLTVVVLFCVSCLVFILPAEGQDATNDAVGRFLKAVDGIKSYDATIVVDMLDYTQTPATPKIVDIETNRDVFAVGLGRRFERNVKGKSFGIGVIDWKTATSTNSQLARALHIIMSGLTYLDYINPEAGDGLFLPDALKLTVDGTMAIQPLEALPHDSRLIGFQLENPKKRGTVHSIIRIWLDSEHGYMLKIMEWHNVSATGQIDLINRMEVKKFLKVDEVAWVPAEASIIDIFNGREWTGYSMKLDEKQSSFNSIKSDELFLAKSLPHMNYEKDGWKWDYPPALLVQARVSDAAIEAPRNGNHAKVTARIVLGAMSAFSVLSLIIVLVAHRKRGAI